MREVRNSDGRLVCRVDDATGTVEISVKGCVTTINRKEDGTTEIIHSKRTA